MFLHSHWRTSTHLPSGAEMLAEKSPEIFWRNFCYIKLKVPFLRHSNSPSLVRTHVPLVSVPFQAYCDREDDGASFQQKTRAVIQHKEECHTANVRLCMSWPFLKSAWSTKISKRKKVSWKISDMCKNTKCKLHKYVAFSKEMMVD